MSPRLTRVTDLLVVLAVALPLVVVGSAMAPVRAQDANTRPEARPEVAAGLAATPGATLPPAVTTRHELVAGGRTLQFSAEAGSIPLLNSAGRLLAEVAYVAYRMETAEPRKRPVTFAFNGGPGSASAWLHLGAMGPWRLPLTDDIAGRSDKPMLVANAETWLDFTDLVFIDPVGTGFSRFVGEASVPPAAPVTGASRRGRASAAREQGGAAWFWSINGDIVSLAEVIQKWLQRNDRLASPIILAGESYGGFRAPRIARILNHEHRLSVSAMVLVSPVLDFDGRRHSLPAYHVNLLPSLAAAGMERRGQAPSRAALAEAEQYAGSAYLVDILRGPGDAAAVSRMSARVAVLTGLPSERIERYRGRLGAGDFATEISGAGARIVSLYDASFTRPAAGVSRRGSRFGDAFTTSMSAPLTNAMLQIYERLGWQPQRVYELLSGATNGSWRWGNSPNPPQSLYALQEVVMQDGWVRVLVTHGFTDLVTPYFASALQLRQLSPSVDASRVRFQVYPGGHMYYSRDASRAALKADAESLLRDTTGMPVP